MRIKTRFIIAKRIPVWTISSHKTIFLTHSNDGFFWTTLLTLQTWLHIENSPFIEYGQPELPDTTCLTPSLISLMVAFADDVVASIFDETTLLTFSATPFTSFFNLLISSLTSSIAASTFSVASSLTFSTVSSTCCSTCSICSIFF